MRTRIAVSLALLAACAPSPAVESTAVSSTTSTLIVAPSTTVATVSRAAAVDLDGFLAELEMTHPAPFHGISREDFVAALDDLKAGIDAMSPASALVETMRLTALLSRQGRDGHQFAIPHEAAEGSILPFRIYEFDDGVFITDALESDLVGTRLVAIGGHQIGEVLAAVEPLVPRDGPATVPSFRPFFTLRGQVLEGLGLLNPGPVEMALERAGTIETVVVDPISFAEFQRWGGQGAFTFLPESDSLRYRLARDDTFWMEDLADGVLYARYSAVTPVGTGQAEEFLRRAVASEKVVLDLRHNPGGDNHNYRLLLAALQDDSVDRSGRLFVLTDRVTFSAASNFATEIEQTTGALFVGEAMGGGLNFWDDVKFHPMPHLPVPMRIGVSTRYWEKSTANDPRLTIDPDIDVPSLSNDFFSGRDTALEAAMAAE
jgi:hypothetical protein